jgi:hypothetical protein
MMQRKPPPRSPEARGPVSPMGGVSNPPRGGDMSVRQKRRRTRAGPTTAASSTANASQRSGDNVPLI